MAGERRARGGPRGRLTVPPAAGHGGPGVTGLLMRGRASGPGRAEVRTRARRARRPAGLRLRVGRRRSRLGDGVPARAARWWPDSAVRPGWSRRAAAPFGPPRLDEDRGDRRPHWQGGPDFDGGPDGTRGSSEGPPRERTGPPRFFERGRPGGSPPFRGPDRRPGGGSQGVGPGGSRRPGRPWPAQRSPGPFDRDARPSGFDARPLDRDAGPSGSERDRQNYAPDMDRRPPRRAEATVARRAAGVSRLPLVPGRGLARPTARAERVRSARGLAARAGSRSGSGPTKSSSPAVARSKRRSSPAGAPCGCSSSRSAARPWNASSCMPRTCGSRSSRSRAAR